MPRFTVDTHLFRELGELLVGRDSTALIELIKNAYDADATSVFVHGTKLDRPDDGSILVKDNGNGMDSFAFKNGFLRVASRVKEQGDRRSTFFQRRFTGAKGIGRLAAHKLAREILIYSVPRPATGEPNREIVAKIDWDRIEEYETLDDLAESNAIVLEERRLSTSSPPGTMLMLSRLRKAWTPYERKRFFADVQSSEVPPFLRAELPKSVLSKPLLFESPLIRDNPKTGTPGAYDFEVLLSGDFASGAEYWEFFTTAANWVLEIRASPSSKDVHYAIEPTKKALKEIPDARGYRTSIPHPNPDDGPHFDARILVREGRVQGKRDQRVWAIKSSGIRIFLEGFRVLPYGDQNDDWLSIDADYTRRPRQLEMLRGLEVGPKETDPDEGLVGLPSNNYVGAVFLTQNYCPSLRLLVNREGFVPEAGFGTLVQVVRIGVDICTRVRARSRYVSRQQRKKTRQGGPKIGAGKTPSSESPSAHTDGGDRRSLVMKLEDAERQFGKARSRLAAGEAEAASKAAREGKRILVKAKAHAEDVIAERSLLWVLASVGTQMSAFVHEINFLLGITQTIEGSIEHTVKHFPHSQVVRRKLGKLHSSITGLRLGLERQASYLLDITTPDARRRRSRQPLSKRFTSAARLVREQADRRRIKIDNSISTSLKSPPMFHAELIAIFANLLTNAVKAAGPDGRIMASASKDLGQVRIRIENTGQAVDLESAERWFKPFESTTSKVDPVLGQGMGLGLTITRYVLESYGATISFVKPSEAYASAVEVAFPGKDDS